MEEVSEIREELERIKAVGAVNVEIAKLSCEEVIRILVKDFGFKVARMRSSAYFYGRLCLRDNARKLLT